MTKKTKVLDQSKEVEAAIFEAMQGICFWVAHRHSYYYKHQLPEGAIVAELANLIEGRMPASHHLYCEVMIKNTLEHSFSEHFNDQRADLILAGEKVGMTECRKHDFSQSVDTIIEVKRGSSLKIKLNDDLKKLVKIKQFNPALKTYLLIVSESKLPTQYGWFAATTQRTHAAEVIATKRKFFIEKINSHVAVRRVCKAMASSKANQVHSAVLVEVLGV